VLIFGKKVKRSHAISSRSFSFRPLALTATNDRRETDSGSRIHGLRKVIALSRFLYSLSSHQNHQQRQAGEFLRAIVSEPRNLFVREGELRASDARLICMHATWRLFLSSRCISTGLVTGWKGAKAEARKIGATFSKHPSSSAAKVGINFFDATCATVARGYFVGASVRERSQTPLADPEKLQGSL